MSEPDHIGLVLYDAVDESWQVVRRWKSCTDCRRRDRPHQFGGRCVVCYRNWRAKVEERTGRGPHYNGYTGPGPR